VTVRIAVAGYGYWGPNLVRNFAELPGAAVHTVCDLDEKALESVRRRHPGVKTTTAFEQLIEDREIDAVAIATPVRSHYALALAALQAGKHVWLEKPMAETPEQARQLAEEAARRGLVLLVDHTFLYTGAVRKMHEIVSSGELGDVYYYDSTRVNLGLFQHDVSVISDLAVHDFAILDLLLGKQPAAVSASGVSHFPGMPESLAHITLFYDGGVIAHTNVNWLAPVKVRQVLLGGSRKMIVYDDLSPSEKVKVYDSGVTFTEDPQKIYQMRVGYRTGDMWAPKLDMTEALRVEGLHFLDCIATGKAPRTDGRMGLRLVQLIESATRSMRSRGETVAVEKPE
jgi:predicted dehydrogenase